MEEAQAGVAEQVAAAQESAAAAVAPVVEAPQADAAAVSVPVVVAVQEAVQEVLPEIGVQRPAIDPRAVDLIIRWEVSSEARYTRQLAWPIWPGGASGVTWCIGYDGGHQTRTTIARDWAAHPDVATLETSSGVVGAPAKPLAASMRAVRTAFKYCRQVFVDASLPAYMASARRAYGGPAFDALPPPAQGVLGSLTYNRGAAMVGDRNREKREIRDDCVPRGDTACIARALRSMCRLWAGTPNGAGLCARREDEARLAVAP